MHARKQEREHVVVLSSSYPSRAGDPAGHFVESEAQAWAARGHRVTVLAPRTGARCDSHRVRHLDLGGDDLFGTPGMGARAREKPLRLRHLLHTQLQLERLLNENEFEGRVTRVTSHWLLPGAWPWGCRLVDKLRAQGHRPTWEVVVHGSDARWMARWPRPIRLCLLRQLQGRGACLRFVSEHLRDLLGRGLPRELADWFANSTVRPAEFDLPRLDSARIETNRARALRSPDGHTWRFCAIVIGRLIKSKRVDIALAAAELIPDARVLVIGEGPERARLEKSYPEAWFLGPLNRLETLEWLASADVLLSASLSEGASTVVREALALNTSVVTAETGGEPDGTTEDLLWTLRRRSS